MLNENLKKLRKERGYSQETLAQELKVVRQTVSKWEKGYSVPDADLLEKMAELFEVPVSEILGSGEYNNNNEISDLKRITDQLAMLNSQIAGELNRKRKARKITLAAVLTVLTLLIISAAVVFFALQHRSFDRSFTLDDGCYAQRINGDNIEVPYLLIRDGQFNVIQNIAMNYQPSGNIIIDGKKVIMKTTYAGKDYIWIFNLIGDNALELQLNKSVIPESESVWYDGMVFVLRDLF